MIGVLLAYLGGYLCAEHIRNKFLGFFGSLLSGVVTSFVVAILVELGNLQLAQFGLSKSSFASFVFGCIGYPIVAAIAFFIYRAKKREAAPNSINQTKPAHLSNWRRNLVVVVLIVLALTIFTFQSLRHRERLAGTIKTPLPEPTKSISEIYDPKCVRLDSKYVLYRCQNLDGTTYISKYETGKRPKR